MQNLYEIFKILQIQKRFAEIRYYQLRIYLLILQHGNCISNNLIKIELEKRDYWAKRIANLHNRFCDLISNLTS